MYTIKNLIIIGTSHISIESVNEVTSAIDEHHPDVIALELDLPRFKKIISKKKEKFKASNILQKGFMLNLIGAWIERYLGKKVGVSPGSEMKKAISLARKNKLNIALIDQNIQITLRKLKTRFTLKEKLNLLKNIFKGIFKPQKIRIDLTKVPGQKLINKLTLHVKKDYPSIYKTLIEERDQIMAHHLLKLMEKHEKVVAVLGAGHVPGLTKIIKCKLQKKKQEP